MEVNKRLINIVILGVGILVVGSLILMKYLKLEEPVFFDHYYDLMVYDNQRPEERSFTLGYITNVQDSKTVVDITFPEYPDIYIQASEYGYTHGFNWGNERSSIPGEVYGRYSVRNVFCKIISLPDTYLDSVLTKAQVSFSDGSEKTVDIGEIHIYEYEPNQPFLEFLSSSGSSGGSSTTSYKVLEDIKLVRIESTLLKQMGQRIKIDVNDQKKERIEGVAVVKSGNLNVSAQIVSIDDIIQRYTRFDIHPKLVFSVEDESEHFARFRNIASMYHSYRFSDVYRYLKAREEI
jgi:hypothetical protein